MLDDGSGKSKILLLLLVLVAVALFVFEEAVALLKKCLKEKGFSSRRGCWGSSAIYNCYRNIRIQSRFELFESYVLELLQLHLLWFLVPV